MVDIVHFAVGVESKIPNFDKIYKDVFPKQSIFKPNNVKIERHLETFFTKYPSTKEVILTNIQPSFMSENVTAPGDYKMLMRSVFGRLKRMNAKSGGDPKRARRMRRGVKTLKKMQADSDLLFEYLTKQIVA